MVTSRSCTMPASLTTVSTRAPANCRGKGYDSHLPAPHRVSCRLDAFVTAPRSSQLSCRNRSASVHRGNGPGGWPSAAESRPGPLPGGILQSRESTGCSASAPSMVVGCCRQKQERSCCEAYSSTSPSYNSFVKGGIYSCRNVCSSGRSYALHRHHMVPSRGHARRSLLRGPGLIGLPLRQESPRNIRRYSPLCVQAFRFPPASIAYAPRYHTSTAPQFLEAALALVISFLPTAREVMFALAGALVGALAILVIQFFLSQAAAWPELARAGRRLGNLVGLKRGAFGRGPGSTPQRPVLVLPSSEQEETESVEWVNMVIRKVWMVYQKNLERWVMDVLQPAIDSLNTPDWVQRVLITDFTLETEPAILRNVQRKSSRQANDLQYQLDLRYTGNAKAFIDVRVRFSPAFSFVVPVCVYDLDVDAQLWVKLRLAPVSPWISSVMLSFVQAPRIMIKLAPFGRVNLMAIPILSGVLTKLLTVDLPAMFVQPKGIRFDIKPSASAVAAAIVAGGGKTMAVIPKHLDETFIGELTITLREARELPVLGFQRWGTSDPYCVISLGSQVRQSKRNRDTSFKSSHYAHAVWNQSFTFLVEDMSELLTIRIRDHAFSLKPNIGFADIAVSSLEEGVPVDVWLPLRRINSSGRTVRTKGQLRLELELKSFVEEKGTRRIKASQSGVSGEAVGKQTQWQAAGMPPGLAAIDPSSSTEEVNQAVLNSLFAIFSGIGQVQLATMLSPKPESAEAKKLTLPPAGSEGGGESSVTAVKTTNGVFASGVDTVVAWSSGMAAIVSEKNPFKRAPPRIRRMKDVEELELSDEDSVIVIPIDLNGGEEDDPQVHVQRLEQLARVKALREKQKEEEAVELNRTVDSFVFKAGYIKYFVLAWFITGLFLVLWRF